MRSIGKVPARRWQYRSVPAEEYARHRMEHRRQVTALEYNRHAGLEPCVPFSLELYDTMWLRLRSMVAHIDKGDAGRIEAGLSGRPTRPRPASYRHGRA
jgi:hypothetical protein